jgi:hypothetical protein
MPCARCGSDSVTKTKFCAECETSYDAWSRQHASDIVWQVFSGGIMVTAIGMLIPLLGAPYVVSAFGILVGFGTFLGVRNASEKRRRQQFLARGDVPRAYLPPPMR